MDVSPSIYSHINRRLKEDFQKDEHHIKVEPSSSVKSENTLVKNADSSPKCDVPERELLPKQSMNDSGEFLPKVSTCTIRSDRLEHYQNKTTEISHSAKFLTQDLPK